MRITMIDYVGYGHSDPARHAANVLLFTKNTRLTMSPDLMKEIESWPEAKVMTELEYMANTIPSSWEHVGYTFLLEGVSRALTHQWVRTRTASYSQQSMRVLDVSSGLGWSYLTGPTIPAIIPSEEVHRDAEYDALTEQQREIHDNYHSTMIEIGEAYKNMIRAGAKIEDARGILPTNILTNIVTSMNLRTLSEMMRKRASSRTQGEYRDVVEALRAEVLRVHPWAKLFIERTFDKAASELEAKILALKGSFPITDLEVTTMIKLIDQMRATA